MVKKMSKCTLYFCCQTGTYAGVSSLGLWFDPRPYSRKKDDLHAYRSVSRLGDFRAARFRRYLPKQASVTDVFARQNQTYCAFCPNGELDNVYITAPDKKKQREPFSKTTGSSGASTVLPRNGCSLLASCRLNFRVRGLLL